MQNVFLIIFIFFFGTIIGSFLNCIIWRLYAKKSFVKGKSLCSNCQHPLRWFDLIPLFSFLFLQGRCRYCKRPISWQYPLVEFSTGLLFLTPFLIIPPFFSDLFLFETLHYFFITSVLIIIFVYDLKHFLIPDKILLPAIFISFFYYLLRSIYLFFFYKNPTALLNFSYALLSGTLFSLFFLCLYLISSGKWIGLGDVKLGFFLGLILGWPKIIPSLFITYLIGGIIGIGLIVFKKKKPKSEIPFAPFLITGFFIAFFFGQDLIRWYLNLTIQ